MVTDYLPISKGVPQGTILGPIIFSVMVNDIQALHPSQNVLVKYADDLTLSIPIGDGYDDNADGEVQNIAEWADNNRMVLNLDKTWEMVLSGNSSKPLPDPIQGIKRRDWLKLLGVTFQDKPCNWDKHFQHMISKACGRLYILRVCKFYGYSKEDLHLLFNSLILSVFYFAIEVWACAYDTKYLGQIDNFFRQAYKFGYTSKQYKINEIIEDRDRKMWDNITGDSSHPLNVLLPMTRGRASRPRGHNYVLPKVSTERFKRTFVNRCLFKFV